jgi:hypothetical protein
MESALSSGLGYDFSGGEWDANLVYGWHDGVFTQHCTLHEMIERRYCTRKFAHGAFKFCFVRNPYDRMVSYYSWLMSSSEFRVHFPLFDYFVANYSKAVEIFPEMLGQLVYSVDCDFVGRFERLESDFGVVCSRLGVEGLKLPVLNDSWRRPDYRDYYSAKSRERVSQMFGAELKEYGYEF